MSDRISPLAGHEASQSLLVNIPRLITAYFTLQPDARVAEHKVAFGTSGHRGSSFSHSFNEWHVLAISQAICEYRKQQGISGPLFIGADTHALSEPALASALEVLAANGVDVMLSEGDEYTPTPAVSHAIVTFNRGRGTGLADGIVMTPSHNPPGDGGCKYNGPDGGPAGPAVTGWIEAAANRHLADRLRAVKRVSRAAALRASTTHHHDFLGTYVDDLDNAIDLDLIRNARVRMIVDPLGGAGVRYWPAIAERYRLDLTVLDDRVDPKFGFVPLDWDGQIRMDPSSRYPMQRLIAVRDRCDIAFACDTDHDRHGIVTAGGGLMPPNRFLTVAADYLFRHRPRWAALAAVGKTVVSSRMIDRVAARLGRRLYEVPVGFKWFADGLLSGGLGFAGEESAGAAFLRRDGSAWTTDKDGITAALLSAEMTAQTSRDPEEIYLALSRHLGTAVTDRVEAPATRLQKALLSGLSGGRIASTQLGGEPITGILTRAPGNDAPIGGIKVDAASGWFAARPSGTEALYRIYAESFEGDRHLARILSEGQSIVDAALSPGSR